MVTEPTPTPEAYLRMMRGDDSPSPGWDAVDSAAFAGADRSVTARVVGGVDEHADELVTLSHDIHAHPELNFEERYSAAAVAGLVSSRGYDVDVGCWGLDTAVRATVGDGSPHIAILAEYDALPGIGHGCGHNVICSSAVGAFLGVAPLVADLGGRVTLMGTPAEEGGGGKELIARAGGFDDVDAAIMVHPGDDDHAHAMRLGLRQVDVTYRGRTAHAAAAAYLGRNALDAAVTAYNSIAQLRQHLLPQDRIHGVITDGGMKANIVPERASLSYYLRSPTVATLEELTDRVGAIFLAAAQTTATGVEIDWNVAPTFLPVRTNVALVSRYVEAMSRRGRRVLRLGSRPAGSTDLGNISVRIPAIHPTLAITRPGTPAHSHEFARAAVTREADEAIVDASIALALTAADYLSDADLRDAARKEFSAAGGVMDVEGLDR